MFEIERSYFIEGKKIIKEVNERSIPIFHIHTEADDTIRLRAKINMSFNKKYSPFMHLYEHLIFNNVKVGNIILKNSTEIFEFAKKHNINVNANTGIDGITIIVDIKRLGAFNAKAKSSKFKRPINWLEEFKDYNIETGVQLLYGLLFNRDFITDENIEKEINIIKSEMDTTRDQIIDSYYKSFEFIYQNSVDVLGTSKDIDTIGLDKIKELIKEFDKYVVSPEYTSILVYYNMNEFGSPEKLKEKDKCFEDNLIYLLRKYFSFNINNFNRRIDIIPSGIKKKYLNYTIKPKLTPKVMHLSKGDKGSPALVYNYFFKTEMDPRNKTSIKNLIELYLYRDLLSNSICDIEYGIYNFIREEKQATYGSYHLNTSKLSHNIVDRNYFQDLIDEFKDNISNPEYKFHLELPLAFCIPLNDTIDVEKLYLEVYNFINKLEINEERFELAKQSCIEEFINLDTNLVYAVDIITFENLFYLIKNTFGLTTKITDNEIIKHIEEIMGDFNIKKYKYRILLKYLDYFKKNITIFKIK
jgi:hypothetical protein